MENKKKYKNLFKTMIIVFVSFFLVIGSVNVVKAEDAAVTDPEEIKWLNSSFSYNDEEFQQKKEEHQIESKKIVEEAKENFIKEGGTEESYQEYQNNLMIEMGFGGSSQGNANCFDFYKYNESEVSIDAIAGEFFPGETIKFKGKVKSAFEHPIAKGQIVAKIYREDENSENTYQNGDFQIDTFVLDENLNFLPNEEKTFEGSWRVPNNLKGANYYIAVYFTSSNRYNLTGVNFMSNVFAAQNYFLIGKTDSENYYYFNKDEIKVNGEIAHVRRPEVNVNETDEVEVSVPLINKDKETKKINIQKYIYQWDTLNQDNLIRTEEETIEVPSESNSVVKIKVKDKNYPEYVVRFKAEDSEMDVRFSRAGISRPRINYPMITKFPIKKGEEFSLQGCFHNMSLKPQNGKFVLQLFHEDEKLAESVYEGFIPGVHSAIKKDFEAVRYIDQMRLVATIYDENGTLIDKDEINYTCDMFGEDACKTNILERIDAKVILGVVIFIILTIVIIFMVVKKKNNKIIK